MTVDKHVFYQHEIADGWIHNSHRQDWRWCPRYFKLRYIEGEATPPSEVMEMGEHFHTFAKFYHKEFKIYEMEEFNNLADLITWQLSYIPEKVLPILKMYIERFVVFECRRYWYYCRTLTNADEEYLPRHVELNLRHRRSDEYYGRAGTIDALFRVQDGRNVILRLREYKVSRKPTFDSKFIGNVRGQLAFYRDLVDRVQLHGKEMSFRFELYNPLMDDSVFPLETGTFSRSKSGVRTKYWFLEYPLGATQTALDKSISSFIEALEADYFPRQPKRNIDYKCRYCPFYSICWGRY